MTGTSNTLGSPLEVAVGGTGAQSFGTDYGVICAGTSGTSELQVVGSVGTSGQVLTSNGASALPSWQAASGVSSITGTTDQITASASTGAVTLSLPASVQIDTAILDSNANAILGINATASAVNYIGIKNSATSSWPYIVAEGTDSEVGINIQTKGSNSAVTFVGSASGQIAQIGLQDPNVGHSVFLTVPSGTAQYEITLPGAQGTTNTVMTNDGSGNLSWQPGSGSAGLQYATGTISSAEFQNINSSPFTLVSAQGAHTLIMVTGFVLEYIYGTAEYSTDTIGVYYSSAGSSPIVQIQADTLIGSNSEMIISQMATNTTSSSPLVTQRTCNLSDENPVNNSIILYCPIGNPSDGDGTFVYHIWYTVIGTTL